MSNRITIPFNANIGSSISIDVDAVRKALAEYDAKHQTQSSVEMALREEQAKYDDLIAKGWVPPQQVKPENQEAKIDWQRVIDEGYLCGFSSVSQEAAQNNANDGSHVHLLNKYKPSGYTRFVNSCGTPWKYCAIRRVPNEIQPHFGGGMPDGIVGEHVTIYFRDGGIVTKHSYNPVDAWAYGCDAEFDDVVAFVIHRPIITDMMRPSSYISQSQGVNNE